MTIHTYRIFYRYPDDETEYAVTLDEQSEEHARVALMATEPIIIVRVEDVTAAEQENKS